MVHKKYRESKYRREEEGDPGESIGPGLSEVLGTLLGETSREGLSGPSSSLLLGTY